MSTPADIPTASRLLVIVVNYNQEYEIGAVLEKLKHFHDPKDVIVVDDGSRDRSPEIARQLGYNVLVHPRNRGVGAAIRSGIHYALRFGYSACATLSANGKMRPEDLSRIAEPVLAGRADYVSGARFMKGGGSPGLNSFRRFAIPLLSLLVWPVLGRRFRDVTCGYRCFRTAIFRETPMVIDQEWLNRYELEYYIQIWACRLKLRIEEVPVVIPYDHLKFGRRSKIVPLIGWWHMLRPFIYLTLGIKR